MKKIYLLIVSMLLSSTFATELFSAPSFDVPATASITQGSGENYILLSNVTDVTSFNVVTVTEGTSLIDGTPTITYTAGQHFARLNIKEKGNSGQVKLTLSSGSTSKNLTVNIVAFSNPGISMELYDIDFWKNANPITTNASPRYAEVIPTSNIPVQSDAFWTQAKWDVILPKWTIGCNAPAPCQPINMGTVALRGFFIPPTTGSYTFETWRGADDMPRLFIGKPGEAWKSATERTNLSTSIAFEAGKVYPMYVVKPFIHQLELRLSVTGPGISKQIIPSSMLAPLYELSKPAAPDGLTINTIMSKSLYALWNEAKIGSKVAKIAGYNIYANGVKKNASPVAARSFLIESLTSSTEYNVFVTSVDELGNESLISEVKTVSTTASSTSKPEKVGAIQKVGATGETLSLSWTAPIVDDSEVIAYDIYVDGVKYNTDYIYDSKTLVRTLLPETSYEIKIVAYSSSLIASDMSDGQNISTEAFNPLDPVGKNEYGEFRLRLNIEKENISWTEGIGINADPKNGRLVKDANYYKSMTDFAPGSYRWGGLDANEYGFETITGPNAATFSTKDKGMMNTSIGKARKDAGFATHAMNVDYCNQIGAYYSLCIGTKDGEGGLGSAVVNYTVDYVNPATRDQTILNLIEYLAGPKTSTYGAIRSAEGFPEPVVDPKNPKFKGIIIEFGNEVWGKKAHNAPTIASDGATYGKWCRNLANVMKTSPYWDEIKDMVYLVYSGRNPRKDNSWGWNESVYRGHNGEVNTFGPSGYLGGNLEYNPEYTYGENVSQYYRLVQNYMKRNLVGFRETMDDQAKEGSGPLKVFLYETQISYESYYGNLGQAVALNDYLTSSMRYASIVPSIFCYDGGEWRIALDDGTPLAHYVIAKLINQNCKGHIVSSSIETNNTLFLERTGTTILDPLLDHDPVGTSVYNNGNKWSILLFSRDYQHDYSVQINLPQGIGTPTNVKKYWVTNNTEDGPSVRESFQCDSITSGLSLTDGDIVYVPKYSMVLYTFEADDPGFEKLPLGYYDLNTIRGIRFEGIDADPFKIATKGGSTKVTAFVVPGTTTSPKAVKWDILREDNPHVLAENPLPSLTVGADGTYVDVNADVDGICDGSYFVRATLTSNSAITATQEIWIANQNIGIDNIQTKQKTMIYPNPAENTLYVKTASNGKYAFLNIYNSTGARVMTEMSASDLIELNISNMAAGNYVIIVEKNGKIESIPFVKK